MKNTLILTLILILTCVFIITALFVITRLQNQLSDCQFEVNHLQTKLYWLQELSDYVPAMEQTLPPLVLAQLKAAAEMIRQKRYKEFERYEQPMLNEKELKRLRRR